MEKIALVTGSSRGLGRSLARALRVAGKVEPIFVDAITDMPQMVALYNGMCGGSAAAIGAVELLRYAFLAKRDTSHWSAQALADLAARQPSGMVLLLAVVVMLNLQEKH